MFTLDLRLSKSELDEDTWEEVRFATVGSGGVSGEVSHPLRDGSGLTNARVAGGLVQGLWQS